MILLKPNSQIDLEHRAYFLRGSPGQSAVIAAAEDGRCSIVSSEFKEVQSYRQSSTLRAIAAHPVAPWLALVDKGSGWLVVKTISGDQLVKIPPPQVVGTAPNWVQQGFGDCFFDESGEFLWLAALRSAEECEISLIETGNWSVVDRVVIQDPFGGSSCSFHDTGRSGLIALWLAAGQDGQQVYWLNRKCNGFSCDLEPRLENTIPPIFSPSKEEFLIVREDGAICKYSWPTIVQTGPSLESPDEDNPFAESLVYLNEQQALAATNEGRVFLLDTARMTIEDEVAIEGHEPRQIGEYYPSLSHERGLGTDIAWFTKVGDLVIFIYRRVGGIDLHGWKDSLLWYSPQ